MKRPRATVGTVAALLVVVGGLSVAVAALASGSPDPADNPFTPGEALATDAGLYASDFGVTQPEAERRLSAQDELIERGHAIRDLAPERFAGMWLEHEGVYRAVVWFTGDPDAAVESQAALISADSPAAIEIRWGAKYTEAALVGATDRLNDVLPPDVGRFGGGVDVMHQRLYLTVASECPWASWTSHLELMFEEELGVPISVTHALGGGMADSIPVLPRYTCLPAATGSANEPNGGLQQWSTSDILGGLAVQISWLAPERYAGAWIDEGGPLRLLVAFIGDADLGIEEKVAGLARDAHAPIELQWGASHPWSSLVEAAPKLRDALPPDAGPSTISVSAEHQWLELTVASECPWASRTGELGQLLEGRLGVPVYVASAPGGGMADGTDESPAVVCER